MKRPSEHYKQLWEKLILPTIEKAVNNIDEEFRIFCDVKVKPLVSLFKEIEKEYRSLRDLLQKECYGSANGGVLDNRKIGAIFSRALIEKKAISFNVEKAYKLSAEKKKSLSHADYNEWVVRNVLVNYKIAYIVGAHLVYLGLMEQWVSQKEEKNFHIAKLNENGALYSYPTNPEIDSFGQNMVIALAREDFSGRTLDMLEFGLQLYQMEIYTSKMIEMEVILDELELHPEQVKEIVKKARAKIFDDI